ncbi:MAG: FtsX-like permease family protein [Lachnospiraceae bacterium]|nr:FtsX-like permease family protein [Lachnospiraceae bacterium]
MNKSFLLVHSNLRRAKGQTLSIAVLILLAAAMLNMWLMLSMDYKQNFDRCHDRLHAEHVTLVMDGDSDAVRPFLERTLQEEKQATEFCMGDCLNMVGSFAYNNGEANTELVILEKEAALSRAIGKVEIVEEGGESSGVYLPMLYKTEDIDIGKTIEINIGSNTVSYTVCGFFNSVMSGSHNCVICELLLTQDQYKELEEAGYAPNATLLSVRIADKLESENFEAALKSKVSAQFPDARVSSNSYVLVTTSRYVSQMICSGIVSAMAFFVLLIALVVIASNIVNYIQENMKNLGALKAMGYTSGQLVRCLLLQFLGISLVVAALGIGFSYLLFPYVNDMMISQTGIPYEVHFLFLPSLLTLVLLGAAVALAVWLSSRRIRKIDPILALRQGIQTHNFQKNHVPLEKTGMSLHLALALKNTLSGVRQNVTVCITMLVLSLVVVFSGLMIKNMILNIEPFLNMVVGEIADSCINVNAGIEENFLREMESEPDVEKIYLYNMMNVRHVGGVELMATLCDDFAQLNNQDVCIEGRFPQYDNEVAIGVKYAREKGLEIGEEITLTVGEREADYLITGFTQISNNLGKDCLLTREGYEKLGDLQNLSFYLNVREGVDLEAFHEKTKEQFAGNINATIDVRAIIDGTASVYVTLLTFIVCAILLLSVVIITFVFYLLVRTMLNHKKHDYGILKALGFTTGQLILQTALSFMPTMILSAATGLVVCSLIINPLMALFLSGIGIVKCTFTVPVGLIAAAGAGMVALAFGIACLLSLRIRKIAPCALLAGE